MLPDDTTIEVWHPITGYEGIYSISNLGRVRRDRRGQHTHIGLILQPATDRYGYRFVNLWRAKQRHKFLIHTLVAMMFVGPRPDGYTVNHKDGVKVNNTPTNLEYLTPADNVRHATRLGLRPHGATHPFVLHPELAARGVRCRRAKLTDDGVREMRELHAQGWSYRRLAVRFAVSLITVYRVLAGKNWKHVV